MAAVLSFYHVNPLIVWLPLLLSLASRRWQPSRSKSPPLEQLFAALMATIGPAFLCLLQPSPASGRPLPPLSVVAMAGEATVPSSTFCPSGEIVAAADERDEEILIAEFDLDKIKTKRHGWGIFRDRRTDLYKVLLTLDGSNPHP